MVLCMFKIARDYRFEHGHTTAYGERDQTSTSGEYTQFSRAVLLPSQPVDRLW